MTQADSVFNTQRLTASKTNPPDQAPMTHDDKLGMVWWNALSEKERAEWSAIAGNTGRVKDAWEAFKRGSMDRSPPVGSTRRRFLTNAAGVAAGSAVLALATIPPASVAAASEADPIFAAIQSHRSAVAARDAFFDERSGFEATLPEGDPKWAQIDQADEDAYEVEETAACEMLNVEPTTLEGVTAILAYTVEVLKRGCAFSRFLGDDGKPNSFEYFLMSNSAEALAKLSAA